MAPLQGGGAAPAGAGAAPLSTRRRQLDQLEQAAPVAQLKPFEMFVEYEVPPLVPPL